MSQRVSKRKLIDFRKQQLWTQEDLAAASGLSVRTIQRVESCGQASMETLKALASAFNVDSVNLLERASARNWLVGPIMGMIGGSIGCGFAYGTILSTAKQLNEPFMKSLPALSFVSIMLAFTILFPTFMIYKYWNYEYDFQR